MAGDAEKDVTIKMFNANCGNAGLHKDMESAIETQLSDEQSVIVITLQEANFSAVRKSISNMLTEKKSYKLEKIKDNLTLTKRTALGCGLMTIVIHNSAQNVNFQSLDNVYGDYTKLKNFTKRRLSARYNKMYQMSRLQVGDKVITLANAHKNDKSVMQRLYMDRNLMQSVYGEPIEIREDKAAADYLQELQSHNFIAIGDMNTRDKLSANDSPADGRRVLGYAKTDEDEHDPMKFNAAVMGGVIKVAVDGDGVPIPTYHVEQMQEMDKKREGECEGGTLDYAFGNCFTDNVKMQEVYKPENEGEHDHSGLSCEVAMPANTMLATLDRMLTVLKRQYDFFYQAGFSENIENMKVIDGHIQELERNKNSYSICQEKTNKTYSDFICMPLLLAHNHCLATGGAVQQLMGEYVDQVELTQTKTRTESMSSDGYASDDSNASNESTSTVGLSDDSFQSKDTAETLGNAVGSNKLCGSYFFFTAICHAIKRCFSCFINGSNSASTNDEEIEQVTEGANEEPRETGNRPKF